MSDSESCFIILLVTGLIEFHSSTILLFAGETGIERLSLFHYLVVCFDRFAARRVLMTIILVRDLHIVLVHELF